MNDFNQTTCLYRINLSPDNSTAPTWYISVIVMHKTSDRKCGICVRVLSQQMPVTLPVVSWFDATATDAVNQYAGVALQMRAAQASDVKQFKSPDHLNNLLKDVLCTFRDLTRKPA